jgi:zinc transport system substrate-binding protein
MRLLIRLLILVLVLPGCMNRSDRPDKKNEKPVILVSILPQVTFLQKIAGDDFTVSLLIPHGANPTTYTILPAQMAEISRADLWFRMGHIGFEFSWADKIIQTNPAMKVIDLSEGLDLIAGGRDESSGKLTGVDPHTWLSPPLVKKMALTMRDELISLRPDRREVYNLGYQQFMKEIDDTDLAIRKILNDYSGRKFISFHPSLSYFAREYGLEQHALQQRGKDPTPGYIAGLIKLARQENIRVIFIQSEFDRENARMFAEEISGEALQVWPLNPEWSENLLTMARMLSDSF